MEAVVRWCLKSRSVVFLAAVILIVSGVYATTRLNQELLPEIEFPIVTVSTPRGRPGPASPRRRSRPPWARCSAAGRSSRSARPPFR